jgi:hypothetical protein
MGAREEPWMRDASEYVVLVPKTSIEEDGYDAMDAEVASARKRAADAGKPLLVVLGRDHLNPVGQKLHDQRKDGIHPIHLLALKWLTAADACGVVLRDGSLLLLKDEGGPVPAKVPLPAGISLGE